MCPASRQTRRARARFKPRPIGETRLELVERVLDAYGLVLVLILATFVVGWGCRPRAGPAG